MSHPYKAKACGGKATAMKRYSEGGGVDMKMVNQGLNMLKGSDSSSKGGDEAPRLPMKLDFLPFQPTPKKALGGKLNLLPKMPMKLKFLKLKGMKNG